MQKVKLLVRNNNEYSVRKFLTQSVKYAETNHNEKWRSWDLRVTLRSTCFVMKCVWVSGYQNLKELQCLVMNTENGLSMFFENLTLAILLACTYVGYAVSQLVEALSFTPEGPDFDSEWGNWDFSLTETFGCTLAPGSIKTLTETSTTDISSGIKTAGV
jgi:hypothetical protein